MSRASSGLSFSAPRSKWTSVANCAGSQLEVRAHVGRRPDQHRDLVLLAEVADDRGFERVVVIDDLLAQAEHRPDADREAERVEERQDPQDRLLGEQVDMLAHLVDVAQDVAVGEDDPLGVAGRARGEDHGGRLVEVLMPQPGQSVPQHATGDEPAHRAAPSLSARGPARGGLRGRGAPLRPEWNRSSTLGRSGHA